MKAAAACDDLSALPFGEGAACEYLTTCKEWPRLRAQLLERLGSRQSLNCTPSEPESPGTPPCEQDACSLKAQQPKEQPAAQSHVSEGAASRASLTDNSSRTSSKQRRGKLSERGVLQWRQRHPKAASTAVLMLMGILLIWGHSSWRGGPIQPAGRLKNQYAHVI